MSKMLLIAKNELMLYFTSAIGWLIMFMFYLISGIMFWFLVSQACVPGESIDTSIISAITGGVLFWLIELIVIPLMCMRLFALDKEKGRISLLYTMPVKSFEIIMGKFLGALIFYLLMWLPTVLYIYLLQPYMTVAFSEVFAAYLALVLTGMSGLGIGVLCSVIFKTQISAALSSFFAISFVLVVSMFSYLLNEGSMGSLLLYLNFVDHFNNISQGLISTRDLIFFISIGIFTLLAATELFELKRSEG